MKLTGQEIKEIYAALLDSYRTDSELEIMLRLNLDVSLDEITSRSDLRSRVFDVIEWAGATDNIFLLIKEAHEHNPSNDGLKNLAEKYQAKLPEKAIDSDSADISSISFNSDELDPISRQGLLVRFIQSRDRKEIENAEALLSKLATDPGYLPIEQYRTELEVLKHEIAVGEEAKREYQDLILLNEFEANKEVVFAAFKNFQKDHPNYDPNNLASVNPVNSLLQVIKSVNSSPYERLEAGYKIAAMPDPREGIASDEQGIPQFAWCEIPSGQFHMGGDDQVREVRPDTLLDLPYIFWISMFPVTYAQFDPFVQENGYENKEFWTDCGWKWCQENERKYPLLRWNEPQWHVPNFPVVGVSWYEAVAYTRWLNSKIGIVAKPRYNATDWLVRLPTETEWEKAARGPNGNKFPFGNEPKEAASNIQTLGLGQPCAVGVFPEDKSPYGVMDMAGNTWEWCISEIDHPLEREVISIHGNKRRIIKGGSYKYYSEYSRCASYAEIRPELETAESSFRVCLIDAADQNKYFSSPET